ncbi:hypothetical protein BURMUCF1_A1912 [Burkholderia multivorans ATCC BAA-247]|nr:hypothetical protein BURMUCF1_A1912 [Burkholderia multivorans ATCC BAA-247]
MPSAAWCCFSRPCSCDSAHSLALRSRVDLGGRRAPPARRSAIGARYPPSSAIRPLSRVAARSCTNRIDR